MCSVVCFIYNNNFMFCTRRKRNSRCKLFCIVPYCVKKSTFVRSIDNNRIHTQFMTQCFCNCSLTDPCCATQEKIRNFSCINKDLKVFFKSSGRIQCSIFLGRYFSTQRNSFIIYNQCGFLDGSRR